MLDSMATDSNNYSVLFSISSFQTSDIDRIVYLLPFVVSVFPMFQGWIITPITPGRMSIEEAVELLEFLVK